MSARRVYYSLRRRAAIGTRLRAIRARADESALQLRHRDALRRGEQTLRSLTGRNNRVHLGAGTDIRAGWYNVDIWLRPPVDTPVGAHVVVHDLRKGLLVPPGSCEAIYSSHFFEHLPPEAGESMLEQCFAALAPGGIFRMAVPDFRVVAERYLAGDEAWFAGLMPRQNWGIHSYPGAESLIDWMTYEVYQNGEHVSVWDGDKAVRLLSAVGFKNTRVVDMDPAWDLDLPVRTAQSVYIVGER